MDRSFSRPSRPSHTILPTRTTSACEGMPIMPTTRSSRSGCFARTAAMRPASASAKLASRAAARSSKDSSIHAYTPCLGPLHSERSPNISICTLSPGAAPGSAILIGSALFTDAFVEIFICFCKGSGVVISSMSSPRASFNRLGSGVTTSTGFVAPAPLRPRAAPTALAREDVCCDRGRFMKGNALWLLLPGALPRAPAGPPAPVRFSSSFSKKTLNGPTRSSVIAPLFSWKVSSWSSLNRVWAYSATSLD
mmetsp:Transcript_58731/g.164799  ORF Transcript_58731/g.164799 Transcript_58731/m.164799 type:complete len:251 (-) Transcript_58731:166-918(-)